MATRMEIVREIQEEALLVLLETKRVCEKHNIKFYLAYGTLLGAVRHEGFIPWDDDIDIQMFREDYELFIDIAPSELGEEFVVQHFRTFPNFWSTLAKVRVRRSKFKHKKQQHFTEDNGPLIDIFPIDYVPTIYSKKQYKQNLLFRQYRKLLTLKSGMGKYAPKKKLRLHIKAKFVSMNHIVSVLDKGSQRWNKGPHKYGIVYPCLQNILQHTFPVCVYGEPSYLNFEGHSMPVPCDYTYPLTLLYGDYMKLPPKAKRKAGHAWNFNDFGPFDASDAPDIRGLQLIELDILNVLDAFCKKHDITYFLGNGSLLGAVRHKGFIPWDDDIDIFMKREDYNKFLTLAKKKLPGKYNLVHFSSVKNCWHPIAQIRYSDDECDYWQPNLVKKTSHYGPCIDIYPLDAIPDSKAFKNTMNRKAILSLKRLLLLKNGVANSSTRMKRIITKLLIRHITNRRMHNMINKLSQKYTGVQGTYYTIWGIARSALKLTFKREHFIGGMELQFEDRKYPVPHNYEEILRTIYGDDFMSLPPEKKRKSNQSWNYK